MTLAHTHLLNAVAQSRLGNQQPGPSASDSLYEKFNAMFPAWPTVVSTIIAVSILLIVLTKLVYNPVKKMHDDRKAYIQGNIDTAISQNKEATKDREQAHNEIRKARMKAAGILNDAKVAVEQVRAKRIAQADAEARRIVEDAKKSIVAQQTKFEEESREAIVKVALAAATKVIEKEVDNSTNQKIIKDFISKDKIEKSKIAQDIAKSTENKKVKGK